MEMLKRLIYNSVLPNCVCVSITYWVFLYFFLVSFIWMTINLKISLRHYQNKGKLYCMTGEDLSSALNTTARDSSSFFPFSSLLSLKFVNLLVI